MKISIHHWSRFQFWILAFSLVLLANSSELRPQEDVFEEGLVLHKRSRTESLGEIRSTTSTMYFSSSAVREASSEGEDAIMFFREGRFVRLNHADKTYLETSLEEYQKELNRISESTRHILENEEILRMLEETLGGKIGEVSVQDQGSGGTIAGFETHRYLIKMAPFQLEVWAAPDLQVPDQYYDLLKLETPSFSLFDVGKLFDALKQIDGLNLKTVTRVHFPGLAVDSYSEVTRVERGPVPVRAFRVPDEYHRTNP